MFADKELAGLERTLGTLLQIVYHYREEAHTKRRRALQKAANKLNHYLRDGHYPNDQRCNLREKNATGGGPAIYFDNLDEAEIHLMSLKRASKNQRRDDESSARLWHARNANV